MGNGTASCSGTITATLTWNNGGNPANPPPPVVVIRETSTASWTGDSGSSANGLGHPEVPGEWSGISSGEKWTVKQNPGTSFTMTCSPTAFCSHWLGLGGFMPGWASVSYKVETFPIRLNLVGIVSPTDKRILIGQKLRATVDLDGLEVSGQTRYTWNVKGGGPFTSYTVSYSAGNPNAQPPIPPSSNATYVGWSSHTEFTGTMSVYLAQPQGVTISCNVETVSPPLVFVVKEELSSVPPERFHQVQTIGTMQLLRQTGAQDYIVDASTPDTFALWGAQYQYPPPVGLKTWGMFYDLWVETPQPFAPPDYGDFAFVQLVNNQSSYVDTNGNVTSHPPGWGLDKDYPHNPPGWVEALPHTQPDGSTRWAVFSDKPGIDPIATYNPYTPLVNSVTIIAVFKLFDYYVPPNSAAGASNPVPLHKLEWKARGWAAWSGSQWTKADNGSSLGASVTYPPHPEWNRVW